MKLSPRVLIVDASRESREVLRMLLELRGATTIEAEDGFDLAQCRTVQARTLLLAGRADRFYTTALFHETVRLIPNSRLRLLDGRGHITVMRDPRFYREVTAFLTPQL